MLSHASSLLVGYLAKPAKRSSGSRTTDMSRLSAMLRPGDVLLTDGTTRAAALVRCLTRSTWAHVSMYVGPLEKGADPRCIVEADVAAGVRAVPLTEFAGQQVRVLRATFLQDDDRRRLADWVVSRIGDDYDLQHAWALAKRLLRPCAPFGMQRVTGTVAEGTRRFICSSLLTQAFLLVGYEISTDQRLVTPRDFDGASGFEVVRSLGDRAVSG